MKVMRNSSREEWRNRIFAYPHILTKLRDGNYLMRLFVQMSFYFSQQDPWRSVILASDGSDIFGINNQPWKFAHTTYNFNTADTIVIHYPYIIHTPSRRDGSDWFFAMRVLCEGVISRVFISQVQGKTLCVSGLVFKWDLYQDST